MSQFNEPAAAAPAPMPPSPAATASPTAAGAGLPSLAALLPKINVATLGLALILFFLPWTNVHCNGTLVVTQSGLQSIYAGGSVSDQLKQMGGDSNGADNPMKSKDNDMGPAILVAAALIAVLAGIAFSIMAIAKGSSPVAPGSLAAAALILLLAQIIFGFPISNSVDKARANMTNGTPGQSQEDAELAKSISSAIQITSEHTGWFYLELIVLAIPAAFYAESRFHLLQRLQQPRPPAPK